MTDLINDEAVCRTATATPGLLTITFYKLDFEKNLIVCILLLPYQSRFDFTSVCHVFFRLSRA